MRSAQDNSTHARTRIYSYLLYELSHLEHIDGEAEVSRLRTAERDDINTIDINVVGDEHDEELSTLGREARVMTTEIIVHTKIPNNLQKEQDAVATMIETFMASNCDQSGCGFHAIGESGFLAEYESTDFDQSGELEQDTGRMIMTYSCIYNIKPGCPGDLI